MISFKLKDLPERRGLYQDLRAINIHLYKVAGYEDIAGFQMSQVYEYIEYVAFETEDEATLFVLTYGDKYRHQRTTDNIRWGIVPW
jgi:hypothetical protein